MSETITLSVNKHIRTEKSTNSIHFELSKLHGIFNETYIKKCLICCAGPFMSRKELSFHIRRHIRQNTDQESTRKMTDITEAMNNISIHNMEADK